MNTKPIISGESLIEIERRRYDELLHKEKYLEIILQAISKMSGYSDVNQLKAILGINEKEEE